MHGAREHTARTDKGRVRDCADTASIVAKKAWQNEAELLSMLQHPYVTKYYETIIDEGSLCIIMEYAPNGTLDARIRKQKESGAPFAEDAITLWFLQLLVAIKYLHVDKKILHRDLKPANIFLGANDVGIVSMCL